MKNKNVSLLFFLLCLVFQNIIETTHAKSQESKELLRRRKKKRAERKGLHKRRRRRGRKSRLSVTHVSKLFTEEGTADEDAISEIISQTEKNAVISQNELNSITKRGEDIIATFKEQHKGNTPEGKAIKVGQYSIEIPEEMDIKEAKKFVSNLNIFLRIILQKGLDHNFNYNGSPFIKSEEGLEDIQNNKKIISEKIEKNNNITQVETHYSFIKKIILAAIADIFDNIDNSETEKSKGFFASLKNKFFGPQNYKALLASIISNLKSISHLSIEDNQDKENKEKLNIKFFSDLIVVTLEDEKTLFTSKLIETITSALTAPIPNLKAMKKELDKHIELQSTSDSSETMTIKEIDTHIQIELRQLFNEIKKKFGIKVTVPESEHVTWSTSATKPSLLKSFIGIEKGTLAKGALAIGAALFTARYAQYAYRGHKSGLGFKEGVKYAFSQDVETAKSGGRYVGDKARRLKNRAKEGAGFLSEKIGSWKEKALDRYFKNKPDFDKDGIPTRAGRYRAGKAAKQEDPNIGVSRSWSKEERDSLATSGYNDDNSIRPSSNDEE